VGTLVFGLIMLLSNVGGIGGGGVAIPLAMYFFMMQLKPAIAISTIAILFATLARFLYNFDERHPQKPGCVSIDYYLANVMMPLTLIGSLIGTFIYRAFPDLVLQIMLTLILIALTWLSGVKYCELHKKETHHFKAAAREAQVKEFAKQDADSKKETSVAKVSSENGDKDRDEEPPKDQVKIAED
jgi:uncharacterized membrane protein YfcA